MAGHGLDTGRQDPPAAALSVIFWYNIIYLVKIQAVSLRADSRAGQLITYLPRPRHSGTASRLAGTNIYTKTKEVLRDLIYIFVNIEMHPCQQRSSLIQFTYNSCHHQPQPLHCLCAALWVAGTPCNIIITRKKHQLYNVLVVK